MHFEGLNLNLLVALDALLTEVSVTKSAVQLNLTQPAMSAALQRLRDYIGDPLLERVGRRFELTPRAKTLAPPLKALLLDMHATFDSIPDFDPASSNRRFSVAMSTFAAELIYPVLADIVSSRAPAVQVELQYIGSDVFNRLNGGGVDCCVTVHDRALFDPSYLQHEFDSDFLLRDPFVLLTSQDHPWPDGDISYDIFCESTLVVVRVGENIRSVVERALDRQATKPAIAHIVPSYLMALQMIAGSHMIGIVRSRIAAQHADRLRLRTLKPPLDLPVLEDALIWHRRTSADSGQIWLRQQIRDAAIRIHGA